MKKVDFIFIVSISFIIFINLYLYKKNFKTKLLLFNMLLILLFYLALNFDFKNKRMVFEKSESTGLKDLLYNYKLGDSVLKDNYLPVRLYYKFYFPNTIVSDYFSKTSETKNYKVLHDIVKKRSKNKIVPKQDEIIFHLRIGDVIDNEYDGNIDELLEGKKHYNYKYCSVKDYLTNYEKIDNKLKNIDKEKYKNIIIVGGYHCKGNREKSVEYIEKISQYLTSKDFNVKTRINELSADEDFIYMCNSKIFFKSGGGYSNLVAKMVELNNNLVF